MKAGNLIEVSHKPSLVKAALANQLPTDFSKLELGTMWPGTITKVMNYGVFVDLTHHIVGLVPNKVGWTRWF